METIGRIVKIQRDCLVTVSFWDESTATGFIRSDSDLKLGDIVTCEVVYDTLLDADCCDNVERASELECRVFNSCLPSQWVHIPKGA